MTISFSAIFILCVLRSRSFLRSADFFQLSLQVIVAFLQKMKDQGNVFSDDKLKPYLRECLGQGCTRELEWLSDCLSTGMHYYLEVESHRRFLRLPMTLADSGFVTELRRGAALRSLRRIFTLCRLERFVQDCSDDILTGKKTYPCFIYHGMSVCDLSNELKTCRTRI